MSEDATAKPRTLVFCFDGTGNEPSDAGEFKEDQSVSNVLKLHILMGGNFADPPARTWQLAPICSCTDLESRSRMVNPIPAPTP